MRPWRLVALLTLVTGPLTAQGKAPHPVPTVPHAQPAPKGTIAVGETVRDSLTRRDPLLRGDSTYAQQWRLPGHAGQTTTTRPFPRSLYNSLFLVWPGP